MSGCGRVDLPGGDPAQMRESLRTLAKLDDHVVLHPGHDYGGGPTSSMAEQRRNNHALLQALE